MFPTLYLLDARLTLDIVVGTKRLFDIFSGGALPLCYLVAIGYADPDIAARRFRDYTPTKAELPPGLSQPLPFGTGGAAPYLTTICEDIIPHLERQYPLDPRERVLIGYSLSGRFATYTLFNEPEAFGRYLIVSPSLWWDRGRPLRKRKPGQARTPIYRRRCCWSAATPRKHPAAAGATISLTRLACRSSSSLICASLIGG